MFVMSTVSHILFSLTLSLNKGKVWSWLMILILVDFIPSCNEVWSREKKIPQETSQVNKDMFVKSLNYLVLRNSYKQKNTQQVRWDISKPTTTIAVVLWEPPWPRNSFCMAWRKTTARQGRSNYELKCGGVCGGGCKGKVFQGFWSERRVIFT